MIWKYLPASWAHELAPTALHFYSQIFGYQNPPEWNPLTWRGLRFPNRLGIAGGVDKNAESLLEWQSLGVGFLEIGTVTPLPQDPNPGKILDRDWDNRLLWNKMGFPNLGGRETSFNYYKAREEIKVPVFVNIGKNRSTPNEGALQDYLSLVSMFPYAQGFVINVSSPNTAGLRNLQTREHLEPLCHAITHAAVPRPVLVKLSPDMSEPQFKDCIEAALAAGIAGFVLTNTTLSRTEGSRFPPEGGVSGRDLEPLSLQALRWARSIIGQRQDVLLVSVGGVMSYEQICQRLDLGAHLIQAYSAIVFHGPRFFLKMHREFLQTKLN